MNCDGGTILQLVVTCERLVANSFFSKEVKIKECQTDCYRTREMRSCEHFGTCASVGHTP